MIRAKMQRLGTFLAGMVIPNIAALIAWGLITALFIPRGWIPNEHLAKLVSPLIMYLLPVLIGFTGGRLVYGIRGGVVGALATMGVAVGSSVPMFIGAMTLGPLGGWVIKKVDQLLEARTPKSLEVLVANFSAGLVGLGLTLLAYTIAGPFMEALTLTLGGGAKRITQAGVLPLISLLIEPGKVLFVNNAINHGILAPLGIAEAKQAGKSIFFLLESNPGPGLGLLSAYWLVGKGEVKQSSPGAIIIHFLGGIHEIYFPYVLMNPPTILAMIAGGMSATATFVLMHAGLVATPAPGSIFAYIAMAPKGGLVPVLSGVLTGALASFLVALPIVSRFRSAADPAKDFAKAKQTVQAQQTQPATSAEKQ
jgi:PTS system mannitol-specific IIC component